jgi:hypothetical protein
VTRADIVKIDGDGEGVLPSNDWKPCSHPSLTYTKRGLNGRPTEMVCDYCGDGFRMGEFQVTRRGDSPSPAEREREDDGWLS